MQHYGCGHEIWEKGTVLEVSVRFNWNLMTLSSSRILINFMCWPMSPPMKLYNVVISQILTLCVSQPYFMGEKMCEERKQLYSQGTFVW